MEKTGLTKKDIVYEHLSMHKTGSGYHGDTHRPDYRNIDKRRCYQYSEYL